jgi:copper chaperone
MHTEHLTVTGMTCGGYTSKVTKALTAIAGVSDVKVSLADGAAVVQYDERATAPEQLKAAVEAAGYGVMADANVPQQRPAKRGCCG